MQKQPKLAAKSDFSDVLDLMSSYQQQAEQGLEAQATRGFLTMQDKLFSNLSSLKNTVVQQTNKMGWGIEATPSQRGPQPVSSPKMVPKAQKNQHSDPRPALPKSPIPQPSRPAPVQQAPVATFEASWPTDNGNNVSNNDWGDFSQAPAAVPNKKNVFDPFAETTTQNSNLAAKHSEDLLSLQSWPGTGEWHTKFSLNQTLFFSRTQARSSFTIFKGPIWFWRPGEPSHKSPKCIFAVW